MQHPFILYFTVALGNMGFWWRTNIFRGHDNVQGATDFGLLFDNLPGYYGLTTGAWAHWSNDGIWILNGLPAVLTKVNTLGQTPQTQPVFLVSLARWGVRR